MPEKKSEKERTHSEKEGRCVIFKKNLMLLAQIFNISSVEMLTYKIKD